MRGLLGCEVVFLEPLDERERFRASVNLTVQPAPDGDVRDAIEAQVQELPQHLTDYERKEVVDVEVSGRSGVRVTGTYRQGTTTVRLDQWFVPEGVRLIALSASIPSERVSALGPIVEEVVARFRIQDS